MTHELISIEHFVPSTRNAGVSLHLRERRPPGPCARAVLFVHGATLSSAVFDIPLPGCSWLDYAAALGWRAFALDVRGYGRSTRPPLMEEPASAHPPWGGGDDAVADVADALDFVRAQSARERLALLGFSWGTLLCGRYVAQADAVLDRLVLYAPLHAERHPDWHDALADRRAPGRLNPELGAWRLVGTEDLRRRWDAMIRPQDKSEWRDEAVLQALGDALLAEDPRSGERDPPRWRVPNGTLADLFEAYSGRPLYDPSRIRIPTLLVRGSDDTDSTASGATCLFDALGSLTKRYVVIGHGTHFLCAERRAPSLFREVQNFLDE